MGLQILAELPNIPQIGAQGVAGRFFYVYKIVSEPFKIIVIVHASPLLSVWDYRNAELRRNCARAEEKTSMKLVLTGKALISALFISPLRICLA